MKAALKQPLLQAGMTNESYDDYYNVMNSTVILFSEEGRIIKYAKLNVAKILNGYELFDKLNIIF